MAEHTCSAILLVVRQAWRVVRKRKRIGCGGLFVDLGGASPLQALMVGTVSRTARVSIARWNLKEAVSKSAARRTETE